MAATFSAQDRQNAFDIIYKMDEMNDWDLLDAYKNSVENADQGDNMHESVLPFFEKKIRNRMAGRE